ncbi:DoxX family protein [Sphingobacterium corticibacter]|uniref:DoxX family protein n=1 Tax=Sphingobacterium corticibacter TaxID=2171749 RepID=A0A2T8HJ88_9SPHI|nr:DoxX family protein [Sphingobacterium corticibacter]PVH25516.1 DoxX family protein [Sphingobacterium corticibacter]
MRPTKSKDIGLLVIRLAIGACMLIFHGIPKVSGGIETLEKIGNAMKHIGITFMPMIWGGAAAGIEVIGSLLFMIGLWTRPVSFLLAGTMLVATIFHLGEGHGWAKSSHTIELFFVFIAFALMGAGKYSVDKK